MPQYLYDETLERIRNNRFSTMSEYIRDLIRKDAFAERLVSYKNDPLEKTKADLTPAADW